MLFTRVMIGAEKVNLFRVCVYSYKLPSSYDIYNQQELESQEIEKLHKLNGQFIN